MTEQTTAEGTSDNSEKSEDLAHQWKPENRASNDYRKTGVVELSVRKIRKILKVIEERDTTPSPSGDGDQSSFHVVGHICDGWEKGKSAVIDEDADHLNAEEGDRVFFSHWDAIPSRLGERTEHVSLKSPRTWKNTKISEDLREQNKTTDWERAQSAHEHLLDAEDIIENLDEIPKKTQRKLDQVMSEIVEAQSEMSGAP